MINNAFDVASKDPSAKVPAMPFPECGAMSQGYIGYHLTQAILGELKHRGIMRSAVNVITQTVVDPRRPRVPKPHQARGRVHDRGRGEGIRPSHRLHGEGRCWSRLATRGGKPRSAAASSSSTR